MKFAAACLAVLVLPLAADAQKSKERSRKDKDKGKPPDVLVLDFKIYREGSNIAVEGRVKNNALLPFKGLILFIEFLEPGGRTISRMNHRIVDDRLEPGDDAQFSAQTPDQVRAVHVRMDAEDKDGRYLTMDKPGPYTIE